MKISVSDEKKRVEEQRRILEENIADFQVRASYDKVLKLFHRNIYCFQKPYPFFLSEKESAIRGREDEFRAPHADIG